MCEWYVCMNVSILSKVSKEFLTENRCICIVYCYPYIHGNTCTWTRSEDLMHCLCVVSAKD